MRSLRRLTAEDAEAIARLDAAVRTSAWSTASWRVTLGLRCVAVGLDSEPADERALAAFAVFSYVLDEAELLFIAVKPEAQGHGLGRGVLREALKALHLQGIHTVHLEVASSNAPALALYRAEGFAQVGFRAGYYPGGGDAVLMTRTEVPAERLDG